MPIRLLKPYNGQAALTTFFGSAAEESGLLNTGGADMRVEEATDYLFDMRLVTGATAAIVRTASYYRMNSSSAQILTLGLTGFFPVGKVITVKQEGTAKTTLTPAPALRSSSATASRRCSPAARTISASSSRTARPNGPRSEGSGGDILDLRGSDRGVIVGRWRCHPGQHLRHATRRHRQFSL
jgi:hypothetical protein